MSLTDAPEAMPPDARQRRAVHPVDEVLPAPRLFILGLQHLFIMYAGAVAVPLIVGGALGLPASTIGLLVNADLLVSGIATVIQSVGIGKIFGVRLPVVAGATFTVLSPMIIVAQKYGLPAVYGALLVSGVFGLLIAKPFSMLIRFFPPLVAGTVIMVIGLSLIGADVSLIAGDDPAAKDYGQVSHIALAGLVILLIVVITRAFRGFISQIAVLLSIAIGTLVAWPMGLLHFSSVHSANWVGFSGFFHFGAPKFEIAAILSVSLAVGLLPAVQPRFYEHFPNDFQVIFGSSITSTVIVVFVLNLVFNHWTWRRKGESAVSLAVREGAVAVDVPNDGVNEPDDRAVSMPRDGAVSVPDENHMNVPGDSAVNSAAARR
jgi:xanthine/uracil permease